MTAETVNHIHRTIPDPNRDSLEISTAAKGGAIKIYGDFSDEAAFMAKIDAAVRVREYAAGRIAGELPPQSPKPPVPESVMAAAEKVVVDGKDIKPVYKEPSETHEKAPVSEAGGETMNHTGEAEKVATLTACEVCGAGITAGQAGVSHMLMNKAMCKDCMKAAGEK